MNAVLRHAAAFSAIGFSFSVVVHFMGLFGKKPPLGYFTFVLQFGAFGVAFGACWAIVWLLGSRGEGFWKSALRDCPRWLKWIACISAGYAIVNMIIFLNRFGNRAGMEPDEIMALVFRGYSGEWMAFYSASLLVYFSAIRKIERDSSGAG